ncbi:unnamed protein product [Prunus brigantina]
MRLAVEPIFSRPMRSHVLGFDSLHYLIATDPYFAPIIHDVAAVRRICGYTSANSLKRLKDANAKYKQVADVKSRHAEFEVGDFVWAILTKYRFPVGEYKLAARKISPVEIVAKINLNAYRLKLPSHLCTAC